MTNTSLAIAWDFQSGGQDDPRYCFPAVRSATRFSKAAVLALSALPLAVAAAATAWASSFLPRSQRIFDFNERLPNVSLTLIDWSTYLSAASLSLKRPHKVCATCVGS